MSLARKKLKILHGNVIMAHSAVPLKATRTHISSNEERKHERKETKCGRHWARFLCLNTNWNLLNLRNRPHPIRMINCVNYIDFISQREREEKRTFSVEKCDKCFRANAMCSVHVWDIDVAEIRDKSARHFISGENYKFITKRTSGAERTINKSPFHDWNTICI